MKARARARLSGREGFTLIEVMMAMAVMITGALGLLALQRAVTRGNYEARQTSTASLIARTAIERLRTDQVSWSIGGPTTTWAIGNMTTSRYLQNTPAPGIDQWVYLAGPGEGFQFDHYGRDLARLPPGNLVEYCVQTRLAWVYLGQAVRADIRVVWDRMGGPGAVPRIATAGCPANPNPADHHMVYATNVLRWMPQ